MTGKPRMRILFKKEQDGNREFAFCDVIGRGSDICDTVFVNENNKSIIRREALNKTQEECVACLKNRGWIEIDGWHNKDNNKT